LQASDIEHVVLERGRVAETWRSERWDGFFLNTPNWATQLPGGGYAGPEPDGFSRLAEIIGLLDDYARDAPVRGATRVTRVRPAKARWLVETEEETLQARNVVVATGAFPVPSVPAAARTLPSGVVQLHSSEYRNPAQLQPGTVLVVGGAQSGCQISEELLRARRDVVLAIGRCGWFPRRYRGHDFFAWAIALGTMDETVDSVAPDARRGCNPALSGNDGGHDCHPRTLAADNAVLAGRIDRIDDGLVRFAPDLAENLRFGDEFAAKFLKRVDDHIRESGIEAPPAEHPPRPDNHGETAQLDLREVGAIIWATGFRPDFSWIDAPIGDNGWPIHARGVSPRDGLYFVGLPWLHKRKSALLLGVGEDAEYIVTHIARKHGEGPPPGPRPTG
jgi:putative flavoprotein involved in K+ transport